MRQYKQLVLAVGVALIMATGAAAPTLAATDKPSIQTVAQSYSTAKPLQQGLIVEIDVKNKASVATATYDRSDKVLGVTVAASASPVNLTTEGGGERVYVVTSGRYNVLVSTQNGAVKTGDFVSISAVDGVGMKADNDVTAILGRAVGTFDGKQDVLSNAELKSSDGQAQKVAIGTVMVDIAIGPSPLKTTGESGVPNFVQKVAISIVGKPISAPQLYASMIVLLLGIGVVASMLYGGIQTGMIAIGRNPLARTSILRNMVQIIIAAVMVFIGCLVAVYLIMKL